VALLTLALGLVVLTAGAELLVRSASKLAAAAGISSLVVGLTVVAFGTSAPELVVSIRSALADQSDVAMGNVLGSNIFNVLFILGISAVIIPLRVSRQLIRVEVPLLVGVSCAVLVLAFDGRIGNLDGLLLTLGLVAYIVWTIVKSRREQSEAQPEGSKGSRSNLRAVAGNVVMLGVGLTMLVVGSRWFVDAAISIARQWDVSELIIGLTIVAAGTSLPEVATSIVAAIRGERDIAVGNVVGSNLFNLLGVLGISSLVSPQGVVVSQTAFQLDMPVMIAVAAACLPIFFTGHLIARWEGALFLAYYAAYTTYLLLAAAHTSLTRQFAVVMLGFVIPLTVIGLAVSVMRSVRAGREISDPPP
jgi:cation:H+ antiporter